MTHSFPTRRSYDLPEIGQVVQYVTACVVVTLFGCHRSSSYRRYAYRIQPAPVPATRLVDKLRRSPAGREIARRTALPQPRTAPRSGRSCRSPPGTPRRRHLSASPAGGAPRRARRNTPWAISPSVHPKGTRLHATHRSSRHTLRLSARRYRAARDIPLALARDHSCFVLSTQIGRAHF